MTAGLHPNVKTSVGGLIIDQEDLMDSETWLDDIAITEGQDIALSEYPELRSQEDEDGLIPVPDAAENCLNGFSYQDHHLIYDSPLSKYTRLTQHCFQSGFENLDLRFVVDYDRLGDPSKRRGVDALERWDGVEHIDRIRESDEISITSVHGGKSYCENKLLDKTDFLFHKQDGNWHFQVEELLPMDGIEPDFSVTYRDTSYDYWTRYLHARTNSKLTECYHIDGAIRVYGNESSFIQRHTEQLQAGKKFKSETERMKLFRIDSDSQPLPSFYELIGLFFKQNPYVKEFFEGKSDKSAELEEQRGYLLESSLGT